MCIRDSFNVNILDNLNKKILTWTVAKTDKRSRLDLSTFNNEPISAYYVHSTKRFQIHIPLEISADYTYRNRPFRRDSTFNRVQKLSVIDPRSGVLSKTYLSQDATVDEAISKNNFQSEYNDRVLANVDRFATDLFNRIIGGFFPPTEATVVANAQSTEFIENLNFILSQLRTNSIDQSFVDNFLVQLIKDVEDGNVEINSN